MVNDFHGFGIVEEVRAIVTLARRIGGEGFTDMTEEDVHELLDSHNERPNDELLNMVDMMQPSAQGDDDDEEEEQEQRSLTLKSLRDFFHHTELLGQQAMEMDPVMDRAIKFKRGLEALLLPYKEAYRHLQVTAKQSKITTFFRPTSASSSMSAVSPASCTPVPPVRSPTPSLAESPVMEEEENVDDPLSC